MSLEGYLAETVAADATSAVVLVEGVSDAAAIESLARLIGRDLARDHVLVLPMGGVTNIRKYLVALGSLGRGIRLAGLCDAGEEHHFVRGLERAGLGRPQNRAEMAALGFFVCVDDLEDELIRALHPDRVVEILDAHGDLARFRTFQRQPAKRDIPIEQQLHRFLGTTSGRKERYGRILAESLDLSHIPQPLADLLAFVA